MGEVEEGFVGVIVSGRVVVHILGVKRGGGRESGIEKGMGSGLDGIVVGIRPWLKV